MRKYFKPQYFSTYLGVDATWYSRQLNDQRTIRVIWRNDALLESPFEGSAPPEIDVHDSVARELNSGDTLWIESQEYEVMELSLPDSEGYMRARLLFHGKHRVQR